MPDPADTQKAQEGLNQIIPGLLTWYESGLEHSDPKFKRIMEVVKDQDFARSGTPLTLQHYEYLVSSLPHLTGIYNAFRLIKQSADLFFVRAGQLADLDKHSAFAIGFLIIRQNECLGYVSDVATKCNIDQLLKYPHILLHEETGAIWSTLNPASLSQRHIDAIFSLCKKPDDPVLLRQEFCDYVHDNHLVDGIEAACQEDPVQELVRKLFAVDEKRTAADVDLLNIFDALRLHFLTLKPTAGFFSSPHTMCKFNTIHTPEENARLFLRRIMTEPDVYLSEGVAISAQQFLAITLQVCLLSDRRAGRISLPRSNMDKYNTIIHYLEQGHEPELDVSETINFKFQPVL